MTARCAHLSPTSRAVAEPLALIELDVAGKWVPLRRVPWFEVASALADLALQFDGASLRIGQ